MTSGERSAALANAFPYIATVLAFTLPVALLGFRGVQIVVTGLWGLLLFQYFRTKATGPHLDLYLIGSVPMLIHFALFGVGGILAMWLGYGQRILSYGFGFNDDAVVSTALLGAAAGLMFLVGFTSANATRVNATQVSVSRAALTVLVLLLLAVDLYARYVMMQTGSYLTWAVADASADYRQTGTLPKVQSALWPILLSLVAGLKYSATAPRERVFWTTVLFSLVVLIIAQGSRLMIILALLIVLVHKLYTSNTDRRTLTNILSPRYLAIYGGAAVLFFGIVGPAIQEARYLVRTDRRAASVSTQEVYVRFLTYYLPRALTWSRLYGAESQRIERGVTLQERVGSYAAYGSAIVSRMDEGFGYMSGDNLNSALQLTIPKYFLDERVPFDADRAVITHFRLGREDLDAGATAVVDIYSYIGIAGSLFLFLLVGIATGLNVKFIVSALGAPGVWISLGLVAKIVPIGNSFVYFIVAIRNNILICIAIYIIISIAGALLGRSAPSRDQT